MALLVAKAANGLVGVNARTGIGRTGALMGHCRRYGQSRSGTLVILWLLELPFAMSLVRQFLPKRYVSITIVLLEQFVRLAWHLTK